MTPSKKATGASSMWRVGPAAAMVAATMGIACAEQHYPSRADQIYDDNANPKPQLAPSRWDRARFHRSGTRGRQGLGASPLHPEGPGNVTR
ncbi:MAG: hypothetical protein ACREC9_07470 [Methylocella sp.]